MSDVSHQTVAIRHGKHASPAHGACVVELASMLAGEPFGDHPAGVCPVIAGFLRGYTDLMPVRDLDELYPYAALVVGTAASRSVGRRRARRILEWARVPTWRLYVRMQTWDLILRPAVQAAFRMDSERRRVLVAKLLDELVAIGAGPAPRADPPPVPEPVPPALSGV
jgi:hypothetical protein